MSDRAGRFIVVCLVVALIGAVYGAVLAGAFADKREPLYKMCGGVVTKIERPELCPDGSLRLIR